ncbi:cytochrome P450 [Mycena latifolia]|nr:cytochrome P450 [Mycena latifolia]
MQVALYNILVFFTGLWLVSKLFRHIINRSKQGTKLNGPSASFLFGVSRLIGETPDSGSLFQQWAAKYGPVYEIPTALWGRRIMLCDPKAVNHFYSMERSVYIKSKLGRAIVSNLFGHGLLWAEGETHKRQRRALTPAFSNDAIRRLTPIFYDSAYKLKGYWDAIIDSTSDGAIIEVEHCMNLVALDSVGIAGFSHDFRTLDGEYSAVAAAFESFEEDSTLSKLAIVLASQLPFLIALPTQRGNVMRNLRRLMNVIADELLEKMRCEKKTHVTDETADRSVIGLLLKAEENNAEMKDVIVAQNTLLVAGYETTSVSLTWALIELARNPEKQTKLREELLRFGSADPTWDQLVSGLPYLDGVVHEILRLHAPLSQTIREAQVDDVIPLGEPITTASGEVVDSIAVPKGTIVTVSIHCMNRSEVFWGPNAKEFEPERWLTFDDEPLRAKEIQGHRHLITFLDGPRTCLGKHFALAEFKAVLSVLIKNFTFEFPDGPQTEIRKHRALIPRPTVAGMSGAQVPLRVRRVD